MSDRPKSKAFWLGTMRVILVVAFSMLVGLGVEQAWTSLPFHPAPLAAPWNWVLRGVFLVLGISWLILWQSKGSWFRLTDSIPTGVRVALLVPLSIFLWWAIAQLFAVAWTNLPDDREPLPAAWNLTFLPVGIWIAWLVLWPSEPEPKAEDVIAELKRDAEDKETAREQRLADLVRQEIRRVLEHEPKRKTPAA